MDFNSSPIAKKHKRNPKRLPAPAKADKNGAGECHVICVRFGFDSHVHERGQTRSMGAELQPVLTYGERRLCRECGVRLAKLGPF